MENIPTSPEKKEFKETKASKAEGLFNAIETLMAMDTIEDTKKYATLTFCEINLRELPLENPEVAALLKEIADTREAARGQEKPDMEKLQETIDKVRDLYERLSR